MKVHKYRLSNEETQIFTLRSDNLLSATCLDNNVVFYSLFDKEKPLVDYEILTVPTGVEFPELKEYTFLDTVKLYGDSIVLHIFYRKL